MGADILLGCRPGPAGIINEIRASLAINQEHELQWIVLWIGCRCSECHCCASYLGAGLIGREIDHLGWIVWHRLNGKLSRLRAVTLWIVVVVPGPNLDGMGADILLGCHPGPAGIINEIRASLAVNQEHELQWIVLRIGCGCGECHCCPGYLGTG